MPGLDIALCKPGDLLLFHGFNMVGVAQGAVQGLKILTALPALISAAQGGARAFQGSADCNHAAIITASTTQRFQMAHATNAGVTSDDIDNYLLHVTGAVKVFRMRGRFDFAALAGKVGDKWSETPDGKPRMGMPYATGKAFLSAFSSSSYGSGGKQRAAFYRADKDKAGGPQDLKNMGEGRSKAVFCSMFVIACYQAVMSDMYVEQMLAMDAKHTTPMYLDGFLKGSQHWEQVNAQKG